MRNDKDILKRLERLEEAVFGSGQARPEDAGITKDFIDLVDSMGILLKPIRQAFDEDDWLVMHAVSPPGELKPDTQVTSFHTLCNEEREEDIAKLCSVLSSKQRIAIIKQLALRGQSSGELAEAMNMAGGHLHHHLRDLLSIGFISKDESGKYKTSRFGINAYTTVAALHRRLSYDNRIDFKLNLDSVGSIKK